MKLLRQVSLETKIRVDEVEVTFPIKSKDQVREREGREEERRERERAEREALTTKRLTMIAKSCAVITCIHTFSVL